MCVIFDLIYNINLLIYYLFIYKLIYNFIQIINITKIFPEDQFEVTIKEHSSSSSSSSTITVRSRTTPATGICLQLIITPLETIVVSGLAKCNGVTQNEGSGAALDDGDEEQEKRQPTPTNANPIAAINQHQPRGETAGRKSGTACSCIGVRPPRKSTSGCAECRDRVWRGARF